MAPPAWRPAYGLLRCPTCRSDLAGRAGALVCAAGHSFDLARSGYVNLLAGRRRLPAAGGDERAQLRRRAAFLQAGHFDFIGDVIAQALSAVRGREWPHVLDAGCGTGHHLARVAAAVAPCCGLGIDLSKQAAELASRRYAHLAFAVADIWAEWPIHDASVDLLLSVFAPKNFAEMARVLRPGGRLAIAFPGSDHLRELRDAFGLLRPHDGKAQRYMAEVLRRFAAVRQERIVRRVHLAPEEVANLILMGPDARHRAAAAVPAWPGSRPVTFDIAILLAERPPRRH